jgi:hypothetical protein
VGHAWTAGLSALSSSVPISVPTVLGPGSVSSTFVLPRPRPPKLGFPIRTAGQVGCREGPAGMSHPGVTSTQPHSQGAAEVQPQAHRCLPAGALHLTLDLGPPPPTSYCRVVPALSVRPDCLEWGHRVFSVMVSHLCSQTTQGPERTGQACSAHAVLFPGARVCARGYTSVRAHTRYSCKWLYCCTEFQVALDTRSLVLHIILKCSVPVFAVLKATLTPGPAWPHHPRGVEAGRGARTAWPALSGGTGPAGIAVAHLALGSSVQDLRGAHPLSLGEHLGSFCSLVLWLTSSATHSHTFLRFTKDEKG